MGACIGIDLGTTNSEVAVIVDGKPELIVNGDGKRITPSLVAFYQQEIIIGETAKALMRSGMSESSVCLVSSIKRQMGTGTKIYFNNREYSPQQIAALILKQLKQDAERYLGTPVEEAVISVPAYFNDVERQATIDAGMIAGFKVEKIINEPTAAALAYGLDHGNTEQRILVYDLGGGTFDVTALHLYEGIIEVKASTGDKHLGGDDFDHDLIRYVLHKYQKISGETVVASNKGDLRTELGRARYYLLKLKCEELKKQLSTVKKAPFSLSLRSSDDHTLHSIDLQITRAEFEALIQDRIERTGLFLDEALALAKWAPQMIDRVLLVGGSTKIPLVERFIAAKFGQKPRREINPDEAVALGAAIDAGLKRGVLDENRALLVMDVTPFSWGTPCIDIYGGELRADVCTKIITAQTKIPCSGEETFYTIYENQTGIDVSIYIGEADLIAENTLVQEFIVTGIPPAPAGQETVKLEYTIDVNGNLTATATVMSTGQATRVIVKAALNRMSPTQISQSRDQLEHDWRKAGLT
ncbi:MAG: Hsp70 family protein [Bacillota bacterium]|jgi:molecular chaperone DnaK